MIRADFENLIYRYEEKQNAQMRRLEADVKDAKALQKEAEAQRDEERARAEKATRTLLQYKELAAKRMGALAALKQQLHSVLTRAEEAAPPEGLERALEMARNQLEEARRLAEAAPPEGLERALEMAR